MSIEFQCPRCEATIRVPDQASGTTGNCPKCKARLRVPAVAGQPPSRAATGNPGVGATVAAASSPRPPVAAAPSFPGPAAGSFEFPCPLCTAPVLVPVAAAGKNGKCPHCSGRIRVPHPAAISAPRLAATDMPRFEPVAPVPAFDPGISTGPNLAPVSNADSVPDFLNFAAQEQALLPGGALTREAPTRGVAPDLAFNEASTKSAEEEPVQRRRVRRRNPWPLLLPLAALALAVGGGLAYFVVRMTSLEGELVAEPVTGDLPRVPIDRIYADISEMPQIQERLSKKPILMKSGEFIEMTIAASEGKLLVQVSAVGDTAIFRVDPNKNPRLSKYAEKHKLQFDRQRGEELVRDGPQFLAEIQRQMKDAGGSPKLMQQFFGTIGLATLVKGLGYHTWAERGDPCVFEDVEGRLYFVLPRGTTKFEMSGREPLSPGHQRFPGHFQVKVTGSPVELPAVPPLPQPAKPGKEKGSGKPDGDKTATDNEDPEKEPPGMSEQDEKDKPKVKGKKKVMLKD